MNENQVTQAEIDDEAAWVDLVNYCQKFGLLTVSSLVDGVLVKAVAE